MSTRANIIVKDRHDHLFFYRHSDGYPEGVQSTLLKFVDLMKTGAIRNNISQGSGWLIVLGALEYRALPTIFEKDQDGDPIPATIQVNDWKVGAYEPTTGLHGDIEHLYVVDMEKMEVREIAIEKGPDYEVKPNWEDFKVIQVLTPDQFIDKGE